MGDLLEEQCVDKIVELKRLSQIAHWSLADLAYVRNALPELLGEIERLQLLADGYTTKQLKDMGYDADR